MPTRWVPAALVAGFAAAVGHLAWGAVFAPSAPSDPQVAGEFPAFVHPDPDARHLYLRRTLRLPQRPRAAWVRVLAHDRVRVFVNGRLVEGQALDGYDVAVHIDLAPYLTAGENVLAVHARQTRVRGRPAVAVDGGFTLSDGEHRIGPAQGWYCGRTFERYGDWWFGKQFDERRWPAPDVVSDSFRARLAGPPAAVFAPDCGRWVTDPAAADRVASFRRGFTLPGRPAAAWVRVTTPDSYRLAVNGTVVDQQEAGVGLRQPLAPVRRVYDVTAFVRAGPNVLSLVLTAPAGPPRLLVDGAVECGSGPDVALATDETWRSCPGAVRGWLDPGAESGGVWGPCRVEAGDLGVPPWGPVRQDVATAVPSDVALGRAAGQLAVVAAVAWLALVCGRAAGRAFAAGGAGVAYLALAAPTVVVAAAVLATFDPRVLRQDVYRPWVLAVVVASVPLQWLLMARLHAVTDIPRQFAARLGRWAAVAVLAAAVVGGFWLRCRDVTTEPLQWDEVENYNATRGALRYGFPMLDVHPDLPRLVIHTSEFQFVFHVLAAAVTDDPRWVVRLPAVLFGTATIALMYVVGRGMFGRPTAVAAAALCAAASAYVPMATVGRYFSQLQFFTLLTTYLVWRLVRDPGPLRPGRLWAAVAAFLGMFFTWEASALVVPALAAAVLLTCRGRLRPVFTGRHLWAACGVVLLAYMLQRAHVNFAQTRFLWVGISLSDIRLLPMWDYQSFQPLFYVWASSWSQDALIPLAGLAAGLAAAIGRRAVAVRFLLAVYLPTCLGMAFLLPNYQFRYIYHVSPLLVLVAAAAACRAGGRVAHLAVAGRPGLRWYGRAVAAGGVTAGVGLGCGQMIETRYLPRFRVDGVSTGLFKFPDLGGPARYVRDHARPGDVILSNNVYQTKHLMGAVGGPAGTADYVPMTGRLFLPATFDRSAGLVDRRDGARVIASPDDFRDLLARHPRVWYICQPGQHNNQNAPTVSDLLVEHFDVVYEDYDCLVLFCGDRHAPAGVRRRQHQDLIDAAAKFLD